MRGPGILKMELRRRGTASDPRHGSRDSTSFAGYCQGRGAGTSSVRAPAPQRCPLKRMCAAGFIYRRACARSTAAAVPIPAPHAASCCPSCCCLRDLVLPPHWLVALVTMCSPTHRRDPHAVVLGSDLLPAPIPSVQVHRPRRLPSPVSSLASSSSHLTPSSREHLISKVGDCPSSDASLEHACVTV